MQHTFKGAYNLCDTTGMCHQCLSPCYTSCTTRDGDEQENLVWHASIQDAYLSTQMKPVLLNVYDIHKAVCHSCAHVNCDWQTPLACSRPCWADTAAPDTAALSGASPAASPTPEELSCTDCSCWLLLLKFSRLWSNIGLPRQSP